MAETVLSTPQLHVPGAFRHAEICEKTKSTVADLIKQDANQHHVFFNYIHYHNHLVHQTLAQFSLGADEVRLKELFENESKIMRPAVPEKSDFKFDGKHCLGNEDYYTSYLKYFIAEVERKGMVPCIEDYIFKNTTMDMFNRFMVGYYHPMIHVGYGVEFGIPLMVAEGLAQTAVHDPSMKQVFENGPPKGAEVKCSIHKSALELLQAAKSDMRFDGVIKFEDADKLKLLAKKVPKVLCEYGDQWIVREELDGPEGLRARATELQALGAMLCTGTQPLDKQIHLDFFLMHTLTSSMFLHTFIEHLNPANGASLLRGKFLVDLSLYVAFNRPTINIDQFKTYPKKSWEAIIKAAIAHYDVHIPKAIRALKHASVYDKSVDSEIYQSMGQMILDGDGWWMDNATGFKEAWETIPARGVKAEPYTSHAHLKAQDI